MTLFRYPGGKTKLRKLIHSALARLQGEIYIEPFFGGGSIGLEYLIYLNPKMPAWINDKDVGIAALWTAVYKRPKDLIDMVRGYTPHKDDFYAFKDELKSSKLDPLQRGFKKLVIHQISYSGLGEKAGSPIGGKTQKQADGTDSKYLVGCRWSPDRLIKCIDLIHKKLAGRLDHGCCTSLDFEKLIPGSGGVMYLDPPYYVQGPALYVESFSEEDHKRMARLLSKTKHSWVLSYDICSQIEALYPAPPNYRLETDPIACTIRSREQGADKIATAALRKSEYLISNKELDYGV